MIEDIYIKKSHRIEDIYIKNHIGLKTAEFIDKINN